MSAVVMEDLRNRLKGYEVTERESAFFKKCASRTQNRVMVGCVGGTAVAALVIGSGRVQFNGVQRVTGFLTFTIFGSYLGFRSGMNTCFDELLRLEDSYIADQAREITAAKHPGVQFEWMNIKPVKRVTSDRNDNNSSGVHAQNDDDVYHDPYLQMYDTPAHPSEAREEESWTHQDTRQHDTDDRYNYNNTHDDEEEEQSNPVGNTPPWYEEEYRSRPRYRKPTDVDTYTHVRADDDDDVNDPATRRVLESLRRR